MCSKNGKRPDTYKLRISRFVLGECNLAYIEGLSLSPPLSA